MGGDALSRERTCEGRAPRSKPRETPIFGCSTPFAVSACRDLQLSVPLVKRHRELTATGPESGHRYRRTVANLGHGSWRWPSFGCPAIIRGEAQTVASGPIMAGASMRILHPFHDARHCHARAGPSRSGWRNPWRRWDKRRRSSLPRRTHMAAVCLCANGTEAANRKSRFHGDNGARPRRKS